MAKNAGESRIPVPRAAVRPSFLPKSRLVGSSKIGGLHGGHRRSTILTGCLPFSEHDDISPTTPRGKFTDSIFASTPLAEGKLLDATYAIPGVWNVKENAEVQESLFLQRGGDEKMLRLQNGSQMSILEDVGESCLIDLSLGPFSDTTTPAPSTPHYLMLNQKQNSFEHDESLGILTPDQMTDFTVGTLGCSRTPSCENLTGGTGGSGGSRLALTRASGSRPSEAEAPTWPEVGEPTEGSSERTPSPEELPLDPKPVDPVEPSTRPVPSSFVTSVTSITSLEAGYQGDGENSRPASRGPDPPPVLPMPSNLPAPCRPQDPMTDSDFFTESDADAHEEIVRGDRRAQVIDGTLFCAPGGRRCPSFTGEEMDSSGIYSDLDKRQDERNADQVGSEDRTPDTADTEVSQRSQPSPVKPEVIINFLQTPTNNTFDTSADSNCSIGAVEMTVIEVNNDTTRPKLAIKPDPAPLKKYKMPKRNVVSKIKAMIESGTKEDPEPRRTVRSPRKSGRWDAVMSKIEAGKTEQRSRPLRKEVKSRLLQSLGPSSSSSSSATNASARRLIGDANNNNNNNSNSSSTSSSNPNNKDKRRTRTRQGIKSPTQETARSSVRSSMSDLSSAPSKDAPKRSPTTASQPRRVANGRNTGSRQQQIRINNGEAKKSCTDVSPLNLDKSPTPLRKSASTRRTAPANGLNAKGPVNPATTTTAAIKDRNGKENNVNSNNVPRNLVIAEIRHQSVQTDNIFEAIREKRTDDTVQALSITVQYLAHELEGFSAPKLRKDCESMKNKWLMARTEVKDLRTSQANLEERLIEEREAHERSLHHLRSELETRHAERIVLLESALEEEKLSFAIRLEEAVQGLKREHEASIKRLKKEHEVEIERQVAEAAKQQSLENEEYEEIEEIEDKEENKEDYDEDEDHKEEANLREQVRLLESALNAKTQEYMVLEAEVKDLTSRAVEKEALRRRVESLESQVRETLSESRKEHRSEIERLREGYEANLERKDAESDRRSFVHDQGAALRAEVWSLRSVLELRSQENAALRTEIDSLRRQVEEKEALEQRVVSLEARCEDLKAQLDGKESYERQISHENEILLGSFHEVSKHNKRLSQRNEELQWRLRQKNEVVNVLANQLATPPQRLSRSLGPELMDNTLGASSLDQTLNGGQPSSSSMVKFMVQKGDSVSWTLEIDESSDSMTSGPPPIASVSRQNSLRVASRKSVDLRARSKSVSISNSTRDQLWNPGYNSTPVCTRRRPRSDPSTAASDVVVAAAANAAEPSPGPRPQEAGGEAMISEEASATSSEDESSTSSDIPRLGMDFPWSKDAE